MEAVHQCSTQGLQFTPAGCSPEHRESAEELSLRRNRRAEDDMHARVNVKKGVKKEKFGDYSWCYVPCRYSGRSVKYATGSSPTTCVLCKNSFMTVEYFRI